MTKTDENASALTADGDDRHSANGGAWVQGSYWRPPSAWTNKGEASASESPQAAALRAASEMGTPFCVICAEWLERIGRMDRSEGDKA